MPRPVRDFCSSAQDVADVIGVSVYTLARLIAIYPWRGAGLPDAKVNGHWRVPRSEVLVWWDWVRRQQSRHPESRRMRPEEAPELQEIRGRHAPKTDA